MDIALVVGFSILLVLTVAASGLLYSHYIYSRNRVFSKTKYSILFITLIAVLFVLTLLAGILFIWDTHEETPIRWATVNCGLSFTISGLSALYLIFVCLIPTLTNKNKIGYNNIKNVDYDAKIKQLEAKIGNVQELKDYLIKHNKNYYTSMLSYYESILKRLYMMENLFIKSF